MAPEIHEGKPYEGAKIDIFAAGLILFIMVSCKLPFDGEATKNTKLYKYIMDKKFDKFWKHHDKHCPNNSAFQNQEFRDLFQSMVAPEPS